MRSATLYSALHHLYFNWGYGVGVFLQLSSMATNGIEILITILIVLFGGAAFDPRNLVRLFLESDAKLSIYLLGERIDRFRSHLDPL